MPDKVVPFKPPPEQPPIVVMDRDWQGCQHIRFDVHPVLPRVFCRDCNQELDPYWTLRTIAEDTHHRDRQIAHLKDEADRLEKALARRLEGRRSDRLADADARDIQRMQALQKIDPKKFTGDIRQEDK